MVRVIPKKKILILNRPEDKTAYLDWWGVAHFLERSRITPTINVGFWAIIDYLKEYQHIYNDRKQLSQIQSWVASVFLINLTFEDENRTQAINILKEDKANGDQMKNLVGHALTHIIPAHTRMYVALVCGMRTYLQCTKDGYVKINGEKMPQLIDNEVQIHGEKKIIKVPRVAAPHSALERLCDYLDLSYVMRLVDLKGCQSTTELIGNFEGHLMLSLYQLFEIDLIEVVL